MRTRTFMLAAALAATSTGSLAAQECVGIPKGGRGFLGVGPAGTDGAGGNSLSFAYRGARSAVMVEHQSLDVFAFANPQKSTSAKASFRINALRGCVTTGASWMSWDTEGDEWRAWDSSDPDVITERHSIGGAYTRLRVPLGLSFGRTFNVKKVSFTPFVNPFVVYEREAFAPNTVNGSTTSSRSSFGGGLSTGVAMRAGWLVIRPTMTITNTRDRALSGKSNWAELALHFGVVF